MPENFIFINTDTAKFLNVEDGETVRLTSPTNMEGVWNLGNGIKKPVEGKIRVRQGMRPGVIAVSWHYGHWAYGSSDVVVDGAVIKGEAKRASGLCPNSVMHADPVLKNVTLQDLIGGSASYYDSKVKIVKLQ
jgi:anaerobic selenocysteine-containing dehydrogenase